MQQKDSQNLILLSAGTDNSPPFAITLRDLELIKKYSHTDKNLLAPEDKS